MDASDRSVTDQSMDTAVRHGLCCQYCFSAETAQLRLKVCSCCKEAHYCSAECQKAHWKEHKPACNAHRKAIATAKDEFGAEFVRAQRKWDHEALPWLAQLVHSVLPQSKLRSHVVLVTTHYQPEATPQFKIVSYKAITLAELRDIHEAPSDVVTEHMRTSLPEATVVGYAVLWCDNAHESAQMARVVPAALDAGTAFRKVDPERLIMAMNTDAFRNM